MSKFIFIVGGVISGLGKGITAASIARLLTGRGYRVTNIKIDAYVNFDAGTMNPTEHGEVFVTDDGIETDQDVGNYERFLNRDLGKANYATTGQIYQSVINKERNLEYGGKCVEVVPHIPLEIIARIENAREKDDAEITIIEIGGTVGEYQNILFIEAARLMKYKRQKDVITALVSYVPIPKTLGEMKTKPTQYASRTLNETGMQADFIICRGERTLDKPRKERIALLCNMHSEDDVISAPDVDNIYKVPLVLEEQKLDERILKKLGLPVREKDIREWKALIHKSEGLKDEVKIAILGKYFTTGKFVLADVYVSVIAAIKHGCWAANVKPKLVWVDSEKIENDQDKVNNLSDFDGVVIPGGFGTRGVEGIVRSIEYLRENGIPFLGLCYGMQMAAVEIARNVCGLDGANTMEIDPDTPHPVINLMPDQLKKLLGKDYGGTMRLGGYPCKLKEGTLMREIYGEEMIRERHRHRYEFNNDYRECMEKEGVVFSGTSPDGKLVETIEVSKDIHPFFIGVQFHPEFRSRPLSPHPLFVKFAKACKEKS
ncbi:MAG: CTP synthase [Candidatus Eremiobacteraeota bacterium]|nr:CTP synthase [Candidatus Eremiobacteraeota bacterium]